MSTRGRNKKNIGIWISVISLILVAAGTAGISAALRLEEKTQTEAADTVENVTSETNAVVTEKKGALRSFVNQTKTEAEPGDNRDVFRIIEVIPHEACSVFPYMIDWKTEKGYDQNTPLGYDGILLTAQFTGGSYGSGLNMFSYPNVKTRDSRPFTYVEEKYQKEYLDSLEDYQKEFATQYDTSRGSKWFRKTKNESALVSELYGYFEYVGEGKGLYYLNTSQLAEQKNPGTTVYGIHYEIQAVPRKGTENAKGYMYACDPAYYWSKESTNSSKPDYKGNKVVGLTDYNYSLKFQKTDDGEYTADKIAYNPAGGEGYDYDLIIVPDKINSWQGGFYYKKAGNYEVGTYQEAGGGSYVRYNDVKKTDGLEKADAALGAGYFLLDKDNTYSEVKRYEVTFKQADHGKGCYNAATPDSWTAADTNYYFAYAGAGKGEYKVTFLYAPSAKVKYSAELQEVTTNQGEYALATTSTDGNGKAKYGKDKGAAGVSYDYAEVIINFDAFAENETKQYPVKDAPETWNGRSGVTSGRYGYADEVGGWVFVPIEKAGDMKQTFLKNVLTDTQGTNSNKDIYFKPGDRIYVTNQQRTYRYYCQDGLQNNEWFKLLCYSSNPLDQDQPYTTMIDGVGIDFDKTMNENLSNEVTKQLLNAFDGQFRIEIIQMTPEKLTPDDVRSADLIYISNQEGINMMSSNWNTISRLLPDEDLPECNWNTYCPWSEGQDLSSDTLMTLYDECIYERNRALIVCHSVINGDAGINRNLTKLYYMMNFFDEAMSWAYFMPEQYPDVASENYSRIRISDNYSTATVDVYKGGEWNTFNKVFLEESVYTNEEQENETEPEGLSEEEIAEQAAEYPQYNLESWKPEYFQVWSTYSHSSVIPGFEYQDDIGHWANIVQDGETKLTVAYYIDPMFMNATTKDNIWKILRNRRIDNAQIVVEVTNGEMTSETIPRRVIYADEFDPESFDIDYKVMLLGTGKNPSVLQDITLTFEDGSLAGKGADLEYNVENVNNVRHGFTLDGSSAGELNPSVTMRKVTITATDNNGKQGSTEVYVIVRESFMLN